MTRAHVSFADAALGTTVKIPMLDESVVEVELPSGVQPGDVISLKGKGVARVDGRGKGTLHVVVQVDVPKKVSARARTLLLELQKELTSNESRKAGNG
jgi:molecular chaperone DnaJ